MHQAIAASVDSFAELDSGKTAAPDDQGDEFHKLNMLIPIFSKCRIKIPWHHSATLECETTPNLNGVAVRARFDQMVSDIYSVTKDPSAFLDTSPDCGPSDCRERVFSTNLPRGDLKLILQSKRAAGHTYTYIQMQAGSA
jgi:hypothetical protein